MLRLSSGLAALFLAASGCGGCGDDPPQCVIDTDCPGTFDRCSAAGQCMPFGEEDAGGPMREDAGGEEDAGPRDGGRDAGTDAGAPDAGSACDQRTGTYVVDSVMALAGGGCGTTAVGNRLTTQRAMMTEPACIIEFVSVDTALPVA